MEACQLVTGNIDTVSTVSEFQNAINAINNNGGNGTILLANGDYPIASTSSFPYITASNVVIRSLSGERDEVIIRDGGNIQNAATENGFLIAGDNVTIADLTIRDVGNHGIQVSGHNLFVHNVRIQDTYEQMIKGSTVAPSIDSAVVQCSLFEYTAGIGPNWYIGGLDIHKGRSWQIHDNIFKNISSPHTTVAEHAIHFWIECADNIVERNLIYNCDRGIGFGLGTDGNQNQGGVIRNNMIYNDGLTDFDDVGIGLESSPDTKVYNNTVFIEYSNAIEYRFGTTTNVDIINNLCNKAIASRNGGTAQLETNITSAESGWFADSSTGDLHLISSIANVSDAGTELPDWVNNDIDKNARPLNSKTDIGADEFLVSTVLEANNPIKIGNDIYRNSFNLKGHLDDYSFQLFDMSGHYLYTITASGRSYSFDLSALPHSVYILQITKRSNGHFYSEKLITH